MSTQEKIPVHTHGQRWGTQPGHRGGSVGTGRMGSSSCICSHLFRDQPQLGPG